MRRASFCLLCFAILSVACPAWAEEPGPALSTDAAAVKAALGSATQVAGEGLSSRADVERFSSGRSFAPAFGSERDSKSLIDAIKGSADHGLVPSWYHLAAIERLGSDLAAAPGDEREKISAQRDVLMADAFLTLGKHLDEGVANPYFSDANQKRPGSRTDLVAVLNGALARHDLKAGLYALAPQTAEYRQLMMALKKADKFAAETVWPKVPESGARKIEPGNRDPRIPAVRARLAAEGFVAGPAQSRERGKSDAGGQAASTPAEEPEDYYSDTLVDAVKRFQDKYGMGADGVIGRWTLAAMNVEPSFRASQVRVNLDRLRALKHVLTTQRYAMVNIPDFSLTIYEGGAPIKQMRVITGMLDRKSPLMSDNIQFIEFSPKWHVPRSIAVKDKLPKIKNDPSYIRKMGMRLFTVGESGMEEVEPESVDWEAVNAGNFSYRIVQEARDDNALGRVKFMFPNRHDVYLHDTPTKSLFEQGIRTFSSGCIRISDPIWFAEYLLKDNESWTRERIQAAMKRESPMDVPLSEHMPIHILYVTARADEKGEPIYRHDVYGFDRTLAKKLCAD